MRGSNCTTLFSWLRNSSQFQASVVEKVPALAEGRIPAGIAEQILDLISDQLQSQCCRETSFESYFPSKSLYPKPSRSVQHQAWRALQTSSVIR